MDTQAEELLLSWNKANNIWCKIYAENMNRIKQLLLDIDLLWQNKSWQQDSVDFVLIFPLSSKLSSVHTVLGQNGRGQNGTDKQNGTDRIIN